jgi:Holliday junction resolvasome RuvABC endonuclease subunit
METVIGIDPGATSGWAVLTVELSPKLLISDMMTWPKKGTKKDVPANTPSGIVACIIDVMRRFGHTVAGAAIEDQYLARNPDSMKKLARNGGRWEEACRCAGIPVEWVNTAVWQSKELGTSKITSAEVKRRCIVKAKGLWGQKLNEHESDAAMIGRYFAIRYFADRCARE